jgi:mannose-6-phosphate isomerase
MINDYLTGEKDIRPWGGWEVLHSGDGYIVKRIEVIAGEKLSLQYHEYRAEVWTIVSGRAMAIIGEKEFELCKGETVHLPIGIKHNIENISKESLIFIEIQMGRVLQEKDIIRLNDKYGRA